MDTKHSSGLITRDLKPVYWSPSSNSALAEAELVYKADHKSRSVYVAFEVNQSSLPLHILEAMGPRLTVGLDLAIWTTTPWTLPSNMVCNTHRYRQ